MITQNREVIVGHIYRHFKGGKYRVLHIAFDSESNFNNLKKVVVYQAMHGDDLIWVRDYDSFISKVDKEKYPESPNTYRFELIEEND